MDSWKFQSHLWELAAEQEATDGTYCMRCFLSTWVTQETREVMSTYSIVDLSKYMTVPSAWGILQNYTFQKSVLFTRLSTDLFHITSRNRNDLVGRNEIMIR